LEAAGRGSNAKDDTGDDGLGRGEPRLSACVLAERSRRERKTGEMTPARLKDERGRQRRRRGDEQRCA
jgi:hypothetical protein